MERWGEGANWRKGGKRDGYEPYEYKRGSERIMRMKKIEGCSYIDGSNPLLHILRCVCHIIPVSTANTSGLALVTHGICKTTERWSRVNERGKRGEGKRRARERGKI